MTTEQKSILYNMGMDRHHWTPQSRFGKSTKKNISWLYRKKHNSWHYLFLHLTLEEVIQYLLHNGVYLKRNNQRDWQIIFKDKSVGEVINLLKRLQRIKNSQGYKRV